MQIAAGLTGAALLTTTCATRIMLFVGGPSTKGSGKIVNTEFTEAIRSHKVRIQTSCQICEPLSWGRLSLGQFPHGLDVKSWSQQEGFMFFLSSLVSRNDHSLGRMSGPSVAKACHLQTLLHQKTAPEVLPSEIIWTPTYSKNIILKRSPDLD